LLSGLLADLGQIGEKGWMDAVNRQLTEIGRMDVTGIADGRLDRAIQAIRRLLDDVASESRRWDESVRDHERKIDELSSRASRISSGLKIMSALL
jgi:methyl-accepting chemotaxis protein